MTRNILNYPLYLYKEGTNCDAFRMMRLSYVSNKNKKAWRFRCYAPNAKSVSVVGDFNGWDRTQNPMTHLEGGLWQGFVVGLKKYDNYKFSIEGADGVVRMKADPFATHAETAPATASKIFDVTSFRWTDADYLTKRADKDIYRAPMNIYEVHLGSVLRHSDGTYLSYAELASHLIPYVVEMGYTHIELLPINEYPFDGSWGYQTTGLFAPTSRHGTPHDFMQFVNKCHRNGIGVIMDIVLSHFPKDEMGLYRFDGTPLYEYDNPKKDEHKSWGTMVYDFGKGSVVSFLTSAVCFWAEYYHIDGFRLDAVASMLYLDYDRKAGEWEANSEGGNYNLEAIAFLQHLNKTVLSRFEGVMMIAEESTAFPMVTMPPDVGGLGFNFKWNMGWMNDVLSYVRIDSFFRKNAHDKITFSISYAFSENYILPFSHDEVVHGKASMISKIPGMYEQKFAGLKTLYAYQMTHPGKKLNFMGNEFGQFIEWDYQKGLDWILLDFDSHRLLREYVRSLNRLYLNTPALYELDTTYDGFKWLVVDDNIQNVLAYYREDSKGERVIVILNFSEVDRPCYSFGVPDSGIYQIISNSNGDEFGGNTKLQQQIETEDIPMHGQNQRLTLFLEGNAALILKLTQNPVSAKNKAEALQN